MTSLGVNLSNEDKITAFISVLDIDSEYAQFFLEVSVNLSIATTYGYILTQDRAIEYNTPKYLYLYLNLYLNILRVTSGLTLLSSYIILHYTTLHITTNH